MSLRALDRTKKEGMNNSLIPLKQFVAEKCDSHHGPE
jgi:hypothetical protein